MITCLLLKVGRFLFGTIWKLSGGMGVSGDSLALWGYIIRILFLPGCVLFVVKFYHGQFIGHCHIYIYIYIYTYILLVA